MSNMNERHHAGYIRRSHRDGELLSQFRKTEQLPADKSDWVELACLYNHNRLHLSACRRRPNH